jgi:hypothetical protein
MATLEQLEERLNGLSEDHTQTRRGMANIMGGLNLLREGNLHFNAGLLVAFEMIKSIWNADCPEENQLTDEMIQEQMNKAVEVLLKGQEEIARQRAEQIESLQERVSPEAREALELLDV